MPSRDAFTIRPFRGDDADYAAAVAVRGAVAPDQTITAAEMKRQDANFGEKQQNRRWLAEVEGEAVGYGRFFHSPWRFHPRLY